MKYSPEECKHIPWDDTWLWSEFKQNLDGLPAGRMIHHWKGEPVYECRCGDAIGGREDIFNHANQCPSFQAFLAQVRMES